MLKRRYNRWRSVLPTFRESDMKFQSQHEIRRPQFTANGDFLGGISPLVVSYCDTFAVGFLTPVMPLIKQSNGSQERTWTASNWPYAAASKTELDCMHNYICIRLIVNFSARTCLVSYLLAMLFWTVEARWRRAIMPEIKSANCIICKWEKKCNNQDSDNGLSFIRTSSGACRFYITISSNFVPCFYIIMRVYYVYKTPCNSRITLLVNNKFKVRLFHCYK